MLYPWLGRNFKCPDSTDSDVSWCSAIVNKPTVVNFDQPRQAFGCVPLQIEGKFAQHLVSNWICIPCCVSIRVTSDLSTSCLFRYFPQLTLQSRAFAPFLWNYLRKLNAVMQSAKQALLGWENCCVDRPKRVKQIWNQLDAQHLSCTNLNVNTTSKLWMLENLALERGNWVREVCSDRVDDGDFTWR